MRAFTVIFIIEATIRKYLISSSLLIMLKYLPLVITDGKKILESMKVEVITSIVISMLSINTHYFSLVPAARDYLGIFLAPILNIYYTFYKKVSMSSEKLVEILNWVVIGGAANGLMTIIQHILGPRHWLSIGVTGEFDAHTFGGGLIAKANGIFANSSGLFQASTIIVVFSLMELGSKTKKYKIILLTTVFLSLVSAILNISSRTYSFPIFGVFAACILIESKKIMQSKNLLLIIMISLVGLVLMNDIGSSIFNSRSFTIGIERVQNADSPWNRFLGRWGLGFAMYPEEFRFYLFPKLGIGTTVASLIGDPEFDAICPRFVEEWEASRILCSFGWIYGLGILIIYKIIPCVLLLKGAVKLLGKSKPLKYGGLLMLLNASIYFLCYPMRTNINMSNVILFGVINHCITAIAVTSKHQKSVKETRKGLKSNIQLKNQ